MCKFDPLGQHLALLLSNCHILHRQQVKPLSKLEIGPTLTLISRVSMTYFVPSLPRTSPIRGATYWDVIVPPSESSPLKGQYLSFQHCEQIMFLMSISRTFISLSLEAVLHLFMHYEAYLYASYFARDIHVIGAWWCRSMFILCKEEPNPLWSTRWILATSLSF